MEMQQRRPSSRLSSGSISNNALNRIVNPDLLAQQADVEAQTASPPRRQRAASTSSAAAAGYRDGGAEMAADSIDYPGIIGSDERGRGRSSVVRTNSERETYLPDGVYEVVEGRVRQLSAGPGAAPGSRGRHAARDAGWAR